MAFDPTGRVYWMAFCSGPCLKRVPHKLYPTSDLWKETYLTDWGWTNHTEVFPDALGLPKSVNLVSTNNQSIFRYQVHETTNVLGRTLPLEFYGVQQIPGANGWRVELTFKGRITSVHEAAKPELPAEVWSRIRPD
jgi:hypothetical protein